MDIYQDEVTLWEGFILNHVYSNFSVTSPANFLSDAAKFADDLILERRKRNFLKEEVISL